MASLSSPGIGSGLDINGIIGKLMQVEARPLTLLQKKEAGFQAKLSAYGTLKGALASLQSAVQTLKRPELFSGKAATSSDPSVLSATATMAASPGSYAINVTALAKAQILHTNVDYGADRFDSGALEISVGGSAPVTVTLNSPQTLAGVRDAINAANAGVSASLIHDGTADRLVLTSNTSGSAGAISLSVAASLNDGERRLSDLIGANLSEAQAASDAALTINGLPVTSSSNTLTSTLGGLTLNLNKTGSATLTVSRNTGAVTAAINSFVKAYNDVVSALKQTTAFDAANNKAATLTGDTTARTIQTQLSSLLGTSIPGIAGNLARLSDLGITVQKEGTLSVDGAKLASVLNDSSQDVAAFFTQTTPNEEGLAVRFGALLEGIIGRDGLIAQRSEGLNASIRDVQRRSEAFQQRLSQIEARYRAQFSALDKMIASMNQTSTFLTHQLANLPSLTSNSR